MGSEVRRRRARWLRPARDRPVRHGALHRRSVLSRDMLLRFKKIEVCGGCPVFSVAGVGDLFPQKEERFTINCSADISRAASARISAKRAAEKGANAITRAASARMTIRPSAGDIACDALPFTRAASVKMTARPPAGDPTQDAFPSTCAASTQMMAKHNHHQHAPRQHGAQPADQNEVAVTTCPKAGSPKQVPKDGGESAQGQDADAMPRGTDSHKKDRAPRPGKRCSPAMGGKRFRGVMTRYPSVDLLFRNLSCVAGCTVASWDDIWALGQTERQQCHAFILNDLFGWPQRLAPLGFTPRRKRLLSTAFSGTGMVEMCGHALGCWHSLLWIERGKAPARWLGQVLPGARGLRDICDLLPDQLRARCQSVDMSFDQLKSIIVDTSPSLKLTLLGHEPGRPIRGLLGDVHAAGPPCTDFSAMGGRAGISGDTMVPFLIWVRLLLQVQPPIIVFENVVLFPLELIRTLFSACYLLDDVVTDPSKLGWPVRRVRRYAILIHRQHRCKWQQIAELFSCLAVNRVLPGRVLFHRPCESGSELGPGECRRLEAYKARFGHDDRHLFDLSQNAAKRPRTALFPRPCLTLATSSGRIFCPGERRVLLPEELLAAQGWPSGATSWPADLPLPDVNNFTASALTRLAGNAMSAVCVGPILWWISQHGFSHLRPRGVEPSRIANLPLTPQHLDGDDLEDDRKLAHGHRRIGGDEPDNNRALIDADAGAVPQQRPDGSGGKLFSQGPGGGDCAGDVRVGLPARAKLCERSTRRVSLADIDLPGPPPVGHPLPCRPPTSQRRPGSIGTGPCADDHRQLERDDTTGNAKPTVGDFPVCDEPLGELPTVDESSAPCAGGDPNEKALTFLRDFAEVVYNILDSDSDDTRDLLRPSQEGSPSETRIRDIYPIPGISTEIAKDHLDAVAQRSPLYLRTVLLLANTSLLGLSLLAGHKLHGDHVRPTSLQRVVQRRALGKAERMCARLFGAYLDLDPKRAFWELIGDHVALERPSSAPLIASNCDLLTPSAAVDPLQFVAQEHRDMLTNAEQLFPGLGPGVVVTGRVNRSDRREYAKLVVRQLRCGKVALFDEAFASEAVFTIGKASGALREIWSGHTLSEHAAPPPRPPHIASPSALLALEATDGDPIRLYKRDAACFFDQLAIPDCMVQWFGRPRLPVDDILQFTDMGWDELRGFWRGRSECAHGIDAHPVCKCWPMGFAWSSFLAQSTLLHRCFAGGLKVSQVLSDDRLVPASSRLMFALATDDLMLFARGSQQRARYRLKAVDQAALDAGIIPKVDKNIDEARDGTAIGIDLIDGVYLAPHAPKLWTLTCGLFSF